MSRMLTMLKDQFRETSPKARRQMLDKQKDVLERICKAVLEQGDNLHSAWTPFSEASLLNHCFGALFRGPSLCRCHDRIH
jgi:hypothetical protein